MGNKSSLLLQPEEIAQIHDETGCECWVLLHYSYYFMFFSTSIIKVDILKCIFAVKKYSYKYFTCHDFNKTILQIFVKLSPKSICIKSISLHCKHIQLTEFDITINIYYLFLLLFQSRPAKLNVCIRDLHHWTAPIVAHYHVMTSYVFQS